MMVATETRAELRGLSWVSHVALLMSIGVLWSCQRAEHPEAVGQRAKRCIEAKDARCIAGLIPKWELDMYGISRGEMETLVSQELLSKWTAISSSVYFSPSSGSASVDFRLRTKDGQESNFGCSAVATDRGIEVIGLVRNIVLLNATAEGRKAGRSASAADRPLLWRDYIAAESGRLERSYGLRGLVYTSESGLVSWADLMKQFEERAARIRSMEGGVVSRPGQ